MIPSLTLFDVAKITGMVLAAMFIAPFALVAYTIVRFARPAPESFDAVTKEYPRPQHTFESPTAEYPVRLVGKYRNR